MPRVMPGIYRKGTSGATGSLSQLSWAGSSAAEPRTPGQQHNNFRSPGEDGSLPEVKIRRSMRHPSRSARAQRWQSQACGKQTAGLISPSSIKNPREDYGIRAATLPVLPGATAPAGVHRPR